MLPPPTSTRQLSRPPPCVSYFCPAHLSDHVYFYISMALQFLIYVSILNTMCSNKSVLLKPFFHCLFFSFFLFSLQSRSGLHLTHVTFSPNGQEVLLSYSGEHVYLMDANSGKSLAVELWSMTSSLGVATIFVVKLFSILNHGFIRTCRVELFLLNN